MQQWLTPAVQAVVVGALLVGAQVVAPRTVAALCGVLPVVVQPVEPRPGERLGLKLSRAQPLWLALRSE